MRATIPRMALAPIAAVAEGATVAAGVAAGTFAWGAFAPWSQLFGRTIRHTSDPGAMALTFDDGPNPAITPKLLRLLAHYDIHATFFLIGRRVRAFPELAAEIAGHGHAIGNHTETHPHLTFHSRHRLVQEIDSCREAIFRAARVEPRWMRPPFGFRAPQLDKVLRRLGYAGVAMWSVWARDWNSQPPEPVIRRLRHAGGGDIVLLHDGDYRVREGDRRHTVAALEFWLPRWKDAGVRFVMMDACKREG